MKPGALLAAALWVLLWACESNRPPQPEPVWDLVIYGGTSAGVMAGIEAARSGYRAVIVEPGQHLGGLSSAGLGQTDTGNPEAIGGLAREFYARVQAHYARDGSWTREARANYRWYRPQADAMWRFEPHVAEAIFEELVAEAGVEVLFGERLERPGGAVRSGPGIERLVLESGRQLAGHFFVDASYEGDLLAAAGVTYTLGREPGDQYGEDLGGVRTQLAVHHQFDYPVDPWIEPGHPESGLLPWIAAAGPGAEGAGDSLVQAYNFRLCLTDDPENRLPFERPPGYDELDYELLLRLFDAGETRAPWYTGAMPNRKTDTNNNGAFSTDAIGLSREWPEASYERREELFREHERYQRGLFWTLANHPRVPTEVRAKAAALGLAADEFVHTGGWPHQLYIREARRMVSDFVVTQADCQGARRPADPVGLAAYNMDSHNVQRYVDAQGHARNEGDVQVPPAAPYPISYRAILPAAGECENLLVPVGLSASHMAFGSIRMEPVFMILGQSAAAAACLALDRGERLRDLDYPFLRDRLQKRGQVLHWP